MNTRKWDTEYHRYVIQLRTMIAHPEGSIPLFKIPQVLDEVVEAYPDLWSFATALDQSSRRLAPWIPRPSRSQIYKNRCPLKVYRLFVRVGRQEIDELAAKELLEKCS